MRPLFVRAAIALACSSLLVGCGGDESDDSSNSASTDTSTDTEIDLGSPEVSVTVINYFTGAPLSSASVRGVWHFTDGETIEATAESDSDGLAVLNVTGVEEATRVVITADAVGFSEQSGAISEPDSSTLETIELALQTANISSLVDGDTDFGLTSEDDDTVVVEISASSLVDSDGAAVSGSVTAEVTFIDPSLDPELMPGTYAVGETDSAGVLESFGAMNTTFTDDEGNELNLADGQTATIRIPVAENSSDLADTIPLYYFDDELGYWVEEGTATLVTVDGVSYYEGEVSHFSTWNADQIFNSVTVNGCVVDENGEAISGARIYSQGQDYVGQSTAYSGSDGSFSIIVRSNSEVLLQVESGDNYAVDTLITSSSDITMSACMTAVSRPVSVTLTWGGEPSDLDTHFVGSSSADSSEDFHIYYSSKTASSNGEQIQLDVDDVTGYGPEVTTMSGFPFAGTYSYRVYHFSGDSDIQASPARVALELDGQSYVYNPPSGDATECWEVFTISVDDSGNVTVAEDGVWSDYSSCYATTSSGIYRVFSNEDADTTNPLRDAVRGKYYAQ